jgi:hypothetical protein
MIPNVFPCSPLALNATWCYLYLNLQPKVVNTTMITKKEFLEQSKRIKRRNYLAGSEARNRLAKKYGFDSYGAMEQQMVSEGKWR